LSSLEDEPRRQRRVVRRPLPRYWRGFFLALCGAAAAGLLVVLVWPNASGLYLLGLYSVVANSFLTPPHEPVILYMARYYSPALVALAGTLGAAIAAFADYDIIGRVLRHPRLLATRDTSAYRWAVRWLMARPFLTIAFFAFAPLPLYVVRILAPATGYPIHRYIAAIAVGRYPRFFLLAWLGQVVPLSNRTLALLFALMVALVLISALIRGRRRVDEQGPG